MAPHQRKTTAIVSNLLAWYSKNRRELPWRRTSDPYGIWVSEIMLQQTQVKTVSSYWDRWMKALPTIESLARTDLQSIYKLWEGLGYYSRARNLQKAAHQIMANHGGQFPTEFDQVLDLPGVGRYTAGAICSIAFNQAKPILDGNVIRVLTRVFGLTGNPKTKVVNVQLWSLAEELVQQAARAAPTKCSRESHKPTVPAPPRCSHLNQSLMELGALVCTPREPRCADCPLRRLCVACRDGLTESLPSARPRPAPIPRRFVAFVVEDAGKFLVRQRPAGAVNGRLWEFPNIEIRNDRRYPQSAARQVLGFSPSQTAALPSVRHSITKYRIRLDVFRGLAVDWAVEKTQGGRWLTRKGLARLPFAAAHKKILAGL